MKEIVRQFAFATGIPVETIKIIKRHTSEEGTIRETVHYHAMGPADQLPAEFASVGEFAVSGGTWADFFSDTQLAQAIEGRKQINAIGQ